MSRRLLRRNADGSRVPNLQTLTGDSGIANLSPYLTINGSTVAPNYSYCGYDAEAATFPAAWGEALSQAGSGTDPLLNQPALGNGTRDEMVIGSADQGYNNSTGSYGDVTTEDMVLEFIGYWDGETAFKTLLAKRTAGSAGYSLQIYDTGRPVFGINDGVGSASIVSPANSIVANSFFHYIVFVDKSGSMNSYVNAVSATPVSVSSVGSLTTTNGLSMFSFYGSANRSRSGLVQCTMWKGAAWLDTHLQAAVALERFQKWSGIYPTKASGTAAPTYSRDCSAYATKWNGTSYDLINCSAGLPRVDYVLDDSGTPFKGMLIEPQGTNLLPYSNDLDNAAWVKSGCTIGASTGVTTPAQSIDYQSIIVDSGTISNPNIADSIACTSDNYSYSAIVRAGSSGFCFLRQYAGATGGSKVYFNLTTGAVASSSGTQVVDSNIESLGGGNYLISAVFTCTSGANLVQVYTADTDGGSAVVGDGLTVNTYVGFIQAELGNKPTSRIYTAGASATRLADDLQYNGDNVTAGQGTIKAEMLVDAHTPAAELSIAALSDGGSTDEMIRSYVDTGTQVPIFNAVDSTVAQWTITGSTDVVDGDIHTVRLPYETNDAKQYVDTALDGTPDTSCAVPTGIDEIDIGQDTSSANQLNGRIRNVAIWGWVEENL